MFSQISVTCHESFTLLDFVHYLVLKRKQCFSGILWVELPQPLSVTLSLA